MYFVGEEDCIEFHPCLVCAKWFQVVSMQVETPSQVTAWTFLFRFRRSKKDGLIPNANFYMRKGQFDTQGFSCYQSRYQSRHQSGRITVTLENNAQSVVAIRGYRQLI